MKHDITITSDRATVEYEHERISYSITLHADGRIEGSGEIRPDAPILAPDLPTDPAEIERIKNQERKRRSCCDPPEGVE